MQAPVKKAIIDCSSAVKKKAKELRNQQNERNMLMEDIFKPITTKIDAVVLSNNLKAYKTPKVEKIQCEYDSNEDYDENSLDSEDKKLNEPQKSYVHKNEDEDGSFLSVNTDQASSEDNDNSYSDQSICKDINACLNKDKRKKFSIPFGVRYENGISMVGNKTVDVNDQDINIDGTSYGLTPGLKQLLFKTKPNLNVVTSIDYNHYKEILTFTCAHKRNFDKNAQIKGDKSFKYKNIIAKIFKTQTGRGLPLKKLTNQENIIYWNDINELVDRLQLLVASRDAGHTGHENEILAIIDELREEKIIY